MRHLVGLVMGVIIAPVLLYAVASATAVATASWPDGSGPFAMEGFAAVGALVVAGLAIALMTRSLPPVVPLVVGTAYVALNALSVLYPPAVEMSLRPAGPLELDWPGADMLLQAGIVGFIGTILVVSALAPRRWRREQTREDEDYISYLASDPEPPPPSGRHSAAAPTIQDTMATAGGMTHPPATAQRQAGPPTP